MAYHPLNLFLRFLLELTAWFSMGLYGWHLNDSAFRYLFMLGIPFLSILIWGIFNVPGDASRSGKAPVIVAGWIRLTIEFITFGFGAWTLFSLGHSFYGYVFSILVIIHYLLSFERIKWLS